jgi:hypothetical protein
MGLGFVACPIKQEHDRSPCHFHVDDTKPQSNGERAMSSWTQSMPRFGPGMGPRGHERGIRTQRSIYLPTCFGLNEIQTRMDQMVTPLEMP